MKKQSQDSFTSFNPFVFQQILVDTIRNNDTKRFIETLDFIRDQIQDEKSYTSFINAVIPLSSDKSSFDSNSSAINLLPPISITLLQLAIQHKNLIIIENLLKDADPSVTDFTPAIASPYANYETALDYAIKTQDIKIIKTIYDSYDKRGVKPIARQTSFVNYLEKIILEQNPNIELFKLLLDIFYRQPGLKNAFFDLKNASTGLSLLQLAVFHDKQSILKILTPMLKKEGYNPESIIKQIMPIEYLQYAVNINDQNLFKQNFEDFKNKYEPSDLSSLLNSKDSEGSTILHRVLEKGENDTGSILLTLLNSDLIDLNIKNSFGMTPLDIVIRTNFKSSSLAYTLLDHIIDLRSKGKIKYDLNARDSEGCSYLDIAIQNSDLMLVQKLIDAGVELNELSTYYDELSGDIITTSPLESAVNILIRTIDLKFNRFGFYSSIRDIVIKLINEGADLNRFISGQDTIAGRLASAVPINYLSGIKNKFKIILQDLQDIILLAYRNYDLGVVRYKDHLINLSHFHPLIAFNAIIQTYKNYSLSNSISLNQWMNNIHGTNGIDYFMHQYSNQNIIKNIHLRLEKLNVVMAPDKAINIFKSGQILLVPIKKQYYLFYDSLCIRINGEIKQNSEKGQGIVIYKIGNKAAFIEEIHKVLSHYRGFTDDSYLLGDFIQICDLQIIASYKISTSTTRNSSISTIIGLLRANLFMEIYKALVVQEKKKLTTETSSEQYFSDHCLQKAKVYSYNIYKEFEIYDKKSADESLRGRGIEAFYISPSKEHLKNGARQGETTESFTAEEFNAVVEYLLSDPETKESLSSSLENEIEREQALKNIIINKIDAIALRYNFEDDGVAVFKSNKGPEKLKELISKAKEQQAKKMNKKTIISTIYAPGGQFLNKNIELNPFNMIEKTINKTQLQNLIRKVIPTDEIGDIEDYLEMDAIIDAQGHLTSTYQKLLTDISAVSISPAPNTNDSYTLTFLDHEDVARFSSLLS